MDSILSISYYIRELISYLYSLLVLKNSQIGMDVVIEDSTSQQKLCANVAAQIVLSPVVKKMKTLTKTLKVDAHPALLLVSS